MEEQFEQLRQAISKDIAAQFQSRDERLRDDLDAKFRDSEERLRNNLDERFRDSEERLHDKLAARFEAREDRLLKTISQDVARQLETAVKHLDDRTAIYMEGAKDLVKKAAEGYGGTLEAIDRRLGELATKWDTTIADHSLALQDHGKRIELLERR